MKKIIFAAITCLAALTAQAQVITSATVSKMYEDAVDATDSELAYNAEYEGKQLTTLYVYNKVQRSKVVQLQPAFMFRYGYDATGLLRSRVRYMWNPATGDWQCMGRLDYGYEDGNYCVEYSRWNPRREHFDQSVDKLAYTLLPDSSVNYVYCYHRNSSRQPYQLTEQLRVDVMPFTMDGYLTHFDK